MILIVDDREPDWVAQTLQANLKSDFQVVTGRLQAGDIFCPEAELAIERKSPGDLLASIADDRLFTQAPRLAEIARFPVLLVSGSLLQNHEDRVVANGRVTGWDWWKVQAALVSAQARGLLLMFCKDSDLAAAVRCLADWCHRSIQGRSVVHRPRFVLDPPPEVSFLAGLPGVGPVTARTLLDYAGSAAWALAVLTDPQEGPRVDGIGTKTVSKVRQFLGLDPQLVLHPISKEV